MSLLRMLRDSLCDLLTSGPSNCEKHLGPFMKNTKTNFSNFVTRDFGDLLATYSSHEKHVFCTSRVKSKTVFKKLFSFPLHHMLFSLSCKPLPLPKPPFSLTKPPFSSSILHQSSRKGMDCLLFSKYFMFLALDFLDFVFLLRFEIMLLEYGLLMFC